LAWQKRKATATHKSQRRKGGRAKRSAGKKKRPKAQRGWENLTVYLEARGKELTLGEAEIGVPD